MVCGRCRTHISTTRLRKAAFLRRSFVVHRQLMPGVATNSGIRMSSMVSPVLVISSGDELPRQREAWFDRAVGTWRPVCCIARRMDAVDSICWAKLFVTGDAMAASTPSPTRWRAVKDVRRSRGQPVDIGS